MKIVEDAVDEFLDNLRDEHKFTYSSDTYYVTSTDCTVDFVRVDYETYDEDSKTSEEVKDDIRHLLTRDMPDLISKMSSGDPINVELFHGVLFKRYIKGKEATSYTIYIAMAVQW